MAGGFLRSLFAGEPEGNAPDPLAALDSICEAQLELRQQLRQAVAEVVAARTRLEMHARHLDAEVTREGTRHRSHLVADPDTGHLGEAASRGVTIAQQAARVRAEAGQLADDEERLRQAGLRLDAEIDRFRTDLHLLRARLGSAQARARAGQAGAALAGDEGAVQMELVRARAELAAVQTHADGLERLVAGRSPGGRIGAEDPFLRELQLSSAEFEAAAELARHRGLNAPAADAGDEPPSSQDSHR
ncbi:MAG: hypothetical protein JF888_01650 [Candidatus Dormibacteraeota bacterium]|uniref:PspA/IM30 family protein n=1 Tax=Candidatus Dormiibacter inghamiae TaxID=3127013 RepID=A0A934NAY0_9BACT|nr:hypothetical protein [Candidatus Dormibacteraeota bacterium]MBJ7607042.1 hypothetical protein [Candidatus Dormibacteraeota bacterium]